MDNKKKEYRKKAKELALQNGFDQVFYYGEWNGYLAYTASRKEDEGRCIGYPRFILVKGRRNRKNCICGLERKMIHI